MSTKVWDDVNSLHLQKVNIPFNHPLRDDNYKIVNCEIAF